MSDPLIQPEVIPLHAEGPAPILLPDPAAIFEDRARRFDHWAAAQPGQRDFFVFMATLSRAQKTASARFTARALPSSDARATCHAHRMPVLPAGLVEPPAEWVDALRAVVAATREASLPDGAAGARRAIERATDAELESLGAALLAFDYEALPSEAVPWLAAGLQVWWVSAVHALGRDDVRSIDVATVCPCCGSLPVASLRRIGGTQQGSRYLVCSLCATQWHMVRVKCSHCESTKGIGYLTLSSDPDSEAGREAATRDVVKAEVCDECSSYLKIVSLEADPLADPVADDLATLALDLLTDERGYARVGPNLFIHPGVAAA